MIPVIGNMIRAAGNMIPVIRNMIRVIEIMFPAYFPGLEAHKAVIRLLIQ
jgi:hypothetical protein